jgi:hypothetical protein
MHRASIFLIKIKIKIKADRDLENPPYIDRLFMLNISIPISKTLNKPVKHIYQEHTNRPKKQNTPKKYSEFKHPTYHAHKRAGKPFNSEFGQVKKFTTLS